MAASLSHTGLIAAATLAAVSAPAQTITPQDPASELYFDMTTGFEVTDNYENLAEPLGTTSLWITDVVLGYDSETKYQALSFAAGGQIQIGDWAAYPDRTTDFQYPFATLDYSRENSSSLFRGGLSYRETDNGIDEVFDFDTASDLIVDQGTRSDARAEIELLTGIDAPVSTSTVLTYHQRRFFDTQNPNQTDQDTTSFETEIGLAINRTTDFLLVAEYFDRNDLENIDSDETWWAAGFGVSTLLSPDLSFRGVLRYEEEELTRYYGSFDGETTTTSSPTLDLSFVKDRPNGSYRFSVGGELDDKGVRTTATLGRDMELPYGEIDFSLGVTRSSDNEYYPVGSVDWTRDYKTRTLGLSFDSRIGDDDDGNESIYSSLNFDFVQELTELAGFQLNLNAAGAEGIEGNTDDYRRAGASISYYHDITRDWTFETGYSHSYYNGNGVEDDVVTKNVVFAQVGRRFSLRN